MACFVVSAAAAIGVGAAKYIVKHHEKKEELKVEAPKEIKFGSEVKWSTKLRYLELTLWSGSLLLAGEHLLHGEEQLNLHSLLLLVKAEMQLDKCLLKWAQLV